MYYEINISLNGEHFFASAERSIPNKDKLQEVYSVLKEKFQESEGYKITVYLCYTKCEEVDTTTI